MSVCKKYQLSESSRRAPGLQVIPYRKHTYSADPLFPESTQIISRNGKQRREQLQSCDLFTIN